MSPRPVLHIPQQNDYNDDDCSSITDDGNEEESFPINRSAANAGPASSSSWNAGVYVIPNHDSFEEKEEEKSTATPSYQDDDDDGRPKVFSKILLDAHGDKGEYSGSIFPTTGKPHGFGRMIYYGNDDEKDGRSYVGFWHHGHWRVWGRATFSNGDSYEGEIKRYSRQGRGMYRWVDGRVYTGSYSQGKFHGHGIFKWPDGSVYEGEFVNGERHGHGEYTFAIGGQQYHGGWKDGNFHGFGTLTWADGRRYRGEWRNNKAHGYGTETYANGNIRHEGQWLDDKPVHRLMVNDWMQKRCAVLTRALADEERGLMKKQWGDIRDVLVDEIDFEERGPGDASRSLHDSDEKHPNGLGVSSYSYCQW